MKYISLLLVADYYNSFVKENRCIRVLDWNTIGRQFRPHTDYRPFIINTATDSETGEVSKTLTFTDMIEMSLSSFNFPGVMTVPPIMEIEYARHELNGTFSKDILDALEQIAYLYTVCVTMNRTNTDLSTVLEEQCVKDLEDIQDALAFMAVHKFHEYNMPKYRSYSIGILYGDSFVTLFKRCKEMLESFIEFYFHLTVMLAMFLVECKHLKLDTWPKHIRISIIDEMRDVIRQFHGFSHKADNVYTYCMTRNVTRQDVLLVETVFNYIIEKVNDMNTNMGTISYYNYTRINGPETINASVRLSSMNINWTNELARAEKEKKKMAETGPVEAETMDS